jgi:hypothetical protein
MTAIMRDYENNISDYSLIETSNIKNIMNLWLTSIIDLIRIKHFPLYFLIFNGD